MIFSYIANKTPVRVYYNFHKKTFSIQEKVQGQWRVVSHKDTFMLSDAKFKVSQKGRERVLREKKKNVHAFIYGLWADSGMGIDAESHETLPDKIFYNPYKYDSFVCGNLTIQPYKVVGAMCVKFNKNSVTAAYTEKIC